MFVENNDLDASEPTVVGDPSWTFVVAGVMFAAVGAGLLAGIWWLVKFIASWVSSLEGAPMKKVATVLEALPEPWFTIGAVAVGALGGIMLAVIGHRESLQVTVSADGIQLARGGASRKFGGNSVSAAFLDRKDLVVLGVGTEELVRESSDLKERDLGRAFAEHGYRWLDRDPYAEQFRLWVPDTPGLSEEANAILKARAEVLSAEKSEQEDVRELRNELVRLGVVVRDDGKRQYYRVVEQ